MWKIQIIKTSDFQILVTRKYLMRWTSEKSKSKIEMNGK